MLTHSLNSDAFNVHDDAYAYLVAPKRVIDLGTLQSDPFNWRLAKSGAGGMACLQAPMVNLLGWSAIRGVDQGLGALLLIDALIWLILRRRIPWLIGLAMLFGMFALVEHQIANVTSYFMTLAMMLGLFCFVSKQDNRTDAGALCVGLLLASLAALKNIALPTALLLVALMIVFRWRDAWRSTARRAMEIIAAAALPLLVWYAPQWGSRIIFIPLEHGSGFDQVSIGYILWWIFTRSDNPAYYLAAPLVIGSISIWALYHTPHLVDVAISLLSVVIGCAAMTWITGGVQITRFNLPIFAFGCLVITAIIGTRVSLRPWLTVLVAIFALGSFAMCRRSMNPQTYFMDYPRCVMSLFSPVVPSPLTHIASSLRKLQVTLQPGAAAMVRTDYPYLLDYARNRLYVVDYPYAASPEPGMDECCDVPSFIAYLKSHSVRYVIYAYENEANFPASLVAQRLSDPYFTPWQRALNRKVPPFNALLRQLIVDLGAIYDDGHTAIVDLQNPP